MVEKLGVEKGTEAPTSHQLMNECLLAADWLAVSNIG
jgi:hypothetical protein